MIVMMETPGAREKESLASIHRSKIISVHAVRFGMFNKAHTMDIHREVQWCTSIVQTQLETSLKAAYIYKQQHRIQCTRHNAAEVSFVYSFHSYSTTWIGFPFSNLLRPKLFHCTALTLRPSFILYRDIHKYIC